MAVLAKATERKQWPIAVSILEKYEAQDAKQKRRAAEQKKRRPRELEPQWRGFRGQ
jgi:hypothetical protein